MRAIAIMGNGPADHLPSFSQYKDEIDLWIGADRGALTLADNGITVTYAVGDFDSVDVKQRATIIEKSTKFVEYPVEKDQTDLEIALEKAIEMRPEIIYLFGVTGGRMDHTLINMQLLSVVVAQKIRGIIVDRWNQVELTKPGTHTVNKSRQYPHISFVPFTKQVRGLSLTGFYYPLTEHDISWGSSRCISNKLKSEQGTFSHEEGMLLLIQSCDTNVGQ